MKVLQILPELNRGGVEKGTLEIAKALVEAGHESWVMSAGGQLVSQLESAGSTHVARDIGKKSPLTLFQVRGLRNWLIEQSFDVLHVRSRMPAWIAWLAWRKIPLATRPRLVSTVHGLHSVSRYSEIMTCGERVIAVSETGENYIKENYPRTDSSKICRIYRGIDPTLYYTGYQPNTSWLSQWNTQFPDLISKKLITLPGRITRLKGHLDFIDVMAEVCKKDDKAIGLIVGGADPKHDFYLLEIQSKIHKLNLQDKVIMTGDRSDLRDIMSISTAVVSLSTKPESFGRTTLEALSLGVPTFGYAHGGVGELLEQIFPIGACEKGATSEVAGRISELLSQEKELKTNSNYQIASHIFTLENMCSQTIALYESLAIN